MIITLLSGLLLGFIIGTFIYDEGEDNE